MPRVTKLKRRTRARPKYHDPEAVRRKRVAAGLSQVDLAERAGVSQPHISAMERGASSPSVEVLHALAEALGCDVEEIMYKTADN